MSFSTIDFLCENVRNILSTDCLLWMPVTLLLTYPVWLGYRVSKVKTCFGQTAQKHKTTRLISPGRSGKDSSGQFRTLKLIIYFLNSTLSLFLRFGSQPDGRGWPGPVASWVCSTVPQAVTLRFNCVPEVGLDK